MMTFIKSVKNHLRALDIIWIAQKFDHTKHEISFLPKAQEKQRIRTKFMHMSQL